MGGPGASLGLGRWVRMIRRKGHLHPRRTARTILLPCLVKRGDLFPFAGSRTGCDDSGSDEEPYKGEGNNEVMHGWFSLGKSNEITHNMIIGQVRKFMNTTSILGRCLDGYYSYHFRCIVRYPCVQE